MVVFAMQQRRETDSALDELTIRRAQKGDRRAQTAVVQAHQQVVFAAVSRILCGRGSVEDVAQDAFIKTLKGLPGFDLGGSARLSTWILTIATRTAIDALRRSQRSERALNNVVPLHGGGDTPEATAQGRELSGRVERAMAQLTADQRAVLVLRAYHDMDYDEIAEAAGATSAGVKSRLSRARSALKELLEDDSNG